jgi:hypothetical protein
MNKIKEMNNEIKTYKKLPLPADSAWDRPVYNPYRLFVRFFYEHFRYTWAHRWFDRLLFDPVSSVTHGLASLWRWLPAVWRDRQWDEAYILRVLQAKVEMQRRALVEANRFVGVDAVNRDMTLVLNLIERVAAEHYGCEYLDYFESRHWFEPTTERDEDGEQFFSWESEVTSERFDEFLGKYPSSLRAVRRENPGEEDKKRLCMLVAQRNEAKARALLFRILRDKMPAWWD